MAPLPNLAVCVLLLASGVASAAGERGRHPVIDAIQSHAKYQAPRGWSRRSNSMGEDHALFYSKGPFEIRVQLLGGPDSSFSGPQDFLDSFSAGGGEKESFKEIGSSAVAGADRALYEHRHTPVVRDPHGPAPASRPVRELLCVVPAGRRYFVLTFSASSDDARVLETVREEWTALLSTFSVVKPY
ncbi:MAG: hypothetical protein HY078_10525 [Elusimicrobia bacterium]|nr:hypothetical protein [Elusimicrobiota bacterium]